MPKYLVSVSYSAEGAKGLRQDGGTKRRQVATNAVESVGGKGRLLKLTPLGAGSR